MSTHRFSPGNPFHWQNGTYEVQRVFPETGQVNIEDVFTGAVRLVERAELVRDWLAGELEFVPKGKDTRREGKNGAIDLSDYPERLVAVARYRYAVIEPLTKLGLSRIPNSMIRERIVEFQKANPAPPGGRSLLTALSLRSVRRWVRDYQEGGHDIRALIPNTRRRGGKGKSRLDEELNAVVEAAIRDRCFHREPTTVDDVLHEVAVRVTEENRLRAGDEPLGLPARATVARRIAALDPRERYAARHGQRAARQAFEQYGQTEYPTVPLERVEIDHTKSDLVVLHDEDDLPLGRLTFTYCLDMATRYPLGYYYLGFEPPSVLAVMECLCHAILPKEDTRERYGTEREWLGHGVPSMLVVDNGREFIGQDLDDACLSLGIVLLRAPVATPYFKAGVERAFRTLNTQLFHTLPGTTFSNVRQRGDYKSEEQACVYLSEVDRIMNLYIVDIYAGREHRGLEGIPARRWEQAVQAGFSPRLPASAADLQILLGRVEYRVIHHYGVEFEALRYNCPDLAPLRARLKGEKAKIKYHPGDISRLWVFDPFAGEYIEVPALGQEYAQGLSLWKHRVIRNAVLEERGEVDLAALGRAKRKIQEIVREGKRRRAGSRSRSARWDTAGQPTRKLAPARQAAEPALPTSQPAPALPSPEPVPDDLAGKPGEGWGLSFDLPRTRQDEVGSN